MSQNMLAKHFHFGEKQNGSHYQTYCKFCVKHCEDDLHETMAWDLDYTTGNLAERLALEEKIHKDGKAYVML